VPIRPTGAWKAAARRIIEAGVAALLPDGRSVCRVLASVDGFLYPHEAVFLYRLAREGPGEGVIVEIGSFRGRSTLCLALGVRRRGAGVVCAVDPHLSGTAAELSRNLERFGALGAAEIIVAPSVQVAATWRRPVRLLFVDGNHEEYNAYADVISWLPHLAPGGFLLLHDSTPLSRFPGPRKVAARVLKVGPQFEATGTIGSITWAQRRGAAVPWPPPQAGKALLDGLLARLKEAD
jgi:predicted O-methyltransferase YrrM